MKQIIHNIRQKPDHHKDRIIWISAAVAVGILLLIWAIVGNGRKIRPDSNFFQDLNQQFQSSQTNVPSNILDPNANIDLNTGNNQ